MNCTMCVKISRSCLAWLFLFSFSSFATIQSEMSSIGVQMGELFPQIFSYEKFADQKNHQQILNRLTEFNKSLQKAGEHFKVTSSMGVPYDIILELSKDAKNSFVAGKKDYARALLITVPQLCISCHGKDQKALTRSTGLEKLRRVDFSSDFEFSQYSMMTRQYDQALQYMDQFIGQTAHFGNSPFVSEAIDQQLEIYLKIKRDPDRAVGLLTKYLGNSLFPLVVKDELHDYVKSINKFKKELAKDHPAKDLSRLKKIFAEHMPFNDQDVILHPTAEERIKLYYLGRSLNEYHQNQSESAYSLYQLGKIELQLTTNYFYSLGSLYLKTCMTQFRQDPFAKRCYKLYSYHQKLIYTGTSGLNLPEDVGAELVELYNLVYKNK